MPNYHVYSSFAASDFDTDLYVTDVEAATAPEAIQAAVDANVAEDKDITVASALNYTYRAYLASAATERAPKLEV